MSVNVSYAPQNETPAEIWIEVSRLFGQTVLSGFSFGILATLYVFCINAILPHLKDPTHRRWAIFNLVYITTILILVGAGTASNGRLAQLVWINNRNYPGGPLNFIANYMNLPEYVWGWAVFVVASWMQDAYVIYRCLIFWEWNYWICGLPILCFVASVSTSIAVLVETALPGEGLLGPLTIDLAICWYVFSVSINVLATLAILARLFLKRHAICSIFGKKKAKLYVGIVPIIVESAAIYSIFGIIFIGCYFRQNPVGTLLLPILGNLEGICPLMIIYRVAIGRGWTYRTMQQLNSSANFSNTVHGYGSGNSDESLRNGIPSTKIGLNSDSTSDTSRLTEENLTKDSNA